MHNVLTVILGGGAGTRLHPLTKYRSKPAVPIGGKYRLIDIPISNCLNSNLYRIFILTQFNSASLNRHIHHGFTLDSFREGFVDIIAAEQTPESQSWFQGTADAVRKSLKHLRPHPCKEILILSGDHIYRMDYRKMIESHRKSSAEITIAVIPVEEEKISGFGVLQVDEKNRIVDFYEKPKHPSLVEKFKRTKPVESETEYEWKVKPYLASMGIYLFNVDVLEKALEDESMMDFGKEVIPNAIQKYYVNAYLFLDYWEDIGTIRSFFEANLDLAQPNPKFDLFHSKNRLFTRIRHLPFSKLNQVTIQRSVVSEGCHLDGVSLRDCLIGIRSRIGPGSKLQRVFMMGADYYETEEERELNRKIGRPDVGIGRNCIIEEAIIDKNARVGNNVIIRRRSIKEHVSGNGWTVREGIMVIEKDAIIPDNSIL
ncbi:MAG: glucose-1-phosphate adenylyltransferase [bacterium]|nr:glucose-1-phosphate adenylyltransferase [bacterium]